MLNGKYYALKEIPKFKLYKKSVIFSAFNEPYILKNLINYDFLTNIISSFQDYDNIFTITTYYEGKPLEYFKMDNITEEQIKFMSACVIQALSYLRKKKIIHRDIMMKNIIMDKDKYFNLIDFSFSIKYKNKDNNLTYLNTYDKVSPPEMLNFSIYDYNSDYYRLGSIIFFLIFKIYPSIIKKEQNISEIVIDYHIIKNYSVNCIDFMNKLLISDYKKRIGYNNINELKKHPWFKGFDWEKLKKKEIISPFNFVSNINKKTCRRKRKSKSKIIIFKKYSNELFYKKLMKNFDYINTKIIKSMNNFNLKF